MYPEIILNSSLSIPTYFLINIIIALVTLQWLLKRTKKFNLPTTFALEVYIVVTIFGFIGARIFHVLYEQPFYYQIHPIEVFYIWQGGFVFYGGALLGFTAGWTYVYLKNKNELFRYMDLFTPLASLSYAVGRIGCFLSGCCYGKACDLPWAYNDLHPTQVYSSFIESIILIIILKAENKKLLPSGGVFFLWVLLHAIGHLFVEQFRGDDRGFQYVLSISSWLSIFLILISAYFLKKILNPSHKI